MGSGRRSRAPCSEGWHRSRANCTFKKSDPLGRNFMTHLVYVSFNGFYNTENFRMALKIEKKKQYK